MTADSSIHVKSVCSDNWKDLESLFNSDSQCKDCWCMNHRLKPNQCPTGIAAKNSLHALVRDEKLTGLLAYIGKTCVGWCAVDPISDLEGHDLYTAESNSWAIHCIFVSPDFRGRGVSKKLIESAINLAKRHSGNKVVAFPIPPLNQGRFPKHEAEFSGRYSTFEKMGFKPSTRSTDFYQEVVLDLAKT